MLSQKIKFLLLTNLCLVFAAQLFAQDLKPIPRRHNKFINKRAILNEQRLGISGGLGTGTYFGDLCDKIECMRFRPNVSIGAMLRMNDNLGLKAEINYFRLYAKDVEYVATRNLDFRSNNLEVYVAGYAQFFPYERYEHKRKTINPYAFLGVGLTYFSPQGSLNGQWVNLRPLQLEGVKYSPVTAVIPFGVGLTIHLTKHYEIQLEGAYRKTFTDRLDDVGGQYVDPQTIDPQGRQLINKSEWYKKSTYKQVVDSQQPRGNSARDDGYFLAQVKVRYVFISTKTNYRLRRAPLRKRF